MLLELNNVYERYFNFHPQLVRLAEESEKQVYPIWEEIDQISQFNQIKVLRAFQKYRISDYHFSGSTGYGYGDVGREGLEEVYADVFGTEKALVRLQISSGTHAISLCLYGILRPGDELLSLTGDPYDTLEEVLGTRGGGYGNLKEWGITYKKVELGPEDKIDMPSVIKAITPKTRMVLLQRSRGYTWRPSIAVEEIAKVVVEVKRVNPNIVFFVDNCYGEFSQIIEPTEVGVDLMAGSLIKNPGGGIAPTGGYVVGKEKYVKMAAARLTAPGIGEKVGATLGLNRLLYQGFYLAPHVVAQSLKGAIFTAQFFKNLGFEVSPEPKEKRVDIIQAIKTNTPEGLVAFCQGLQKFSPVDSHVSPQPAEQPGYGDRIIMAAGAFIQGASIELSADGPLREPYIAYLQGGLTKEQVKIGVIGAAQNMLNEGLITL